MAFSNSFNVNNLMTPPITPTTPSHPHTWTHDPAYGQPSQVGSVQRPILTPPERVQSPKSGSDSTAAGNGEQGQQKKKRGRPPGSKNKPKPDPSQPPPPKPEPKPLGRRPGSKDTKARIGYNFKDAEKEANRIARALAARQKTQRRQPRSIAARRQQPRPASGPAVNTLLEHADSPIPARRPARQPAIATNEARPLVPVQPIRTRLQNIDSGNVVLENRATSQLDDGSGNNIGNLYHMGISNDHWDIMMQNDQPIRNQQTAAPQHNRPSNPVWHDANFGGHPHWQPAAAPVAAYATNQTILTAQQPRQAYNNSSPFAPYLPVMAAASHHTARFESMVQQPTQAYDNSTNYDGCNWQPPPGFLAQQAMQIYQNDPDFGPSANTVLPVRPHDTIPIATGNEQQPFELYNNNSNDAAAAPIAPVIWQPIEAHANNNDNDGYTEMTGQEDAGTTDEEVGSLDFKMDAFLDADGNLASCFTE